MENYLLDFLGNLASVADKLGAFAIALAVIIMFTSGRWSLGSRVAEADKRIADAAVDYQRQLDWLDARRKEERDDRLAAEETMRNLVEKFDDVIVLVRGLGEELTRGSKRNV